MNILNFVISTEMPKEPCLECGKTIRQDFFGYCMDCSDENGISDLFSKEDQKKNLEILKQRVMTSTEKEVNLRKMQENLAKNLKK